MPPGMGLNPLFIGSTYANSIARKSRSGEKSDQRGGRLFPREFSRERPEIQPRTRKSSRDCCNRSSILYCLLSVGEASLGLGVVSGLRTPSGLGISTGKEKKEWLHVARTDLIVPVRCQKRGRNQSLRPQPTTEKLFFLLLYNSRIPTRGSVTSVDTFPRLIGAEAET